MTYGVGIAGSGFMGRTWTEVAAHLVDRSRVVGVALGRRAAALAADYDVNLYESYDEMLADDNIDVVVLATPPAVHRAETVAAAAAGKHLLVEKPMAQTVGECQLMNDACAAANTAISVVSQQRFRGAAAAAKRLIDDGEIGEIRMARVIGPTVGFWDTTVTQDEWKLDPTQQTAFASWGAHACDLLRWFIGSTPTFSQAVIDGFGQQPLPGSSAMATYRFANGAMAQVWMSYDIPSPGLGSGLQFELVGQDGIIELDAYGDLRLGRGDGWTVPFTMPDFDPTDPVDPVRLGAYVMQFEDLLDAIEFGRLPTTDGIGGLATIAMIEAAERSAATGDGVVIDA